MEVINKTTQTEGLKYSELKQHSVYRCVACVSPGYVGKHILAFGLTIRDWNGVWLDLDGYLGDATILQHRESMRFRLVNATLTVED